MWRNDNGTATGCQQPVELFHGADDVSHVFDQVNRTNLSEHAVAEREREMIQIRDHIGPGAWIPIRPIAPGCLLSPQPTSRTGNWRIERGALTDTSGSEVSVPEPSGTAPVYRLRNPPDRV